MDDTSLLSSHLLHGPEAISAGRALLGSLPDFLLLMGNEHGLHISSLGFRYGEIIYGTAPIVLYFLLSISSTIS